KADWQSESRKPAIDMTQGEVDIRHTQDEANRLVADFRDECELWNNELLELVRHELDLRLGERHKTPILFPRLIVNLPEPPAFFANILEISSADRDRPTLPETFGQWSQARGGFCRIGKPPGVPVFRFCKAGALDQLPVIRRIMCGQNRRCELESVDQETADVVR